MIHIHSSTAFTRTNAILDEDQRGGIKRLTLVADTKEDSLLLQKLMSAVADSNSDTYKSVVRALTRSRPSRSQSK